MVLLQEKVINLSEICMKHFITKLIENPKIEDPYTDEPDVHKHFTRYSKGIFDGPVVKISQTKNNIKMWSSYEYEDLLLRIILNKYPENDIDLTGTLISSGNFKELIKKFGLGTEFYPKKSKGKTKNYKTKIKTAVSVPKDILVRLADESVPYIYNLFNFSSSDNKYTLTTKSKPPRPSSKNPDDAKINSKLKFCKLKMPNTPENLKGIIEEIAKDFVDEIPAKWKRVVIQNSYEITDLELPKRDNKISSRKFRIKTIRMGKLNRIATIDGDTFKKTIDFRA